ncbi:MAG TPA: CHASE3 domain-containing protein [Azospirillaceae bacterium]|nr:CHASE3 domain-containing protein [Azospirillaceae bacterium]
MPGEDRTATAPPGPQAAGRLGLVAIWTAFLLAVGVALLLGEALDRLRAAQGETRTTADFLLLTERMFSAVKDAETGQRGYLLAGEDRYLVPFRNGQEQTRALMTDFTRRAASFEVPAADVERLRRLIEEKLDELNRTVELAAAGDRDQALAILRGGEGKRLMDEIRARVEGIRRLEDGRLAQRVGNLDRQSDRASLLAAATTLIAFLALGWAAMLLTRRLREERRRFMGERDQAMRRLEETAERLRVALEVAGLGIFDWDVTADHHVWTPETYHILGVEPGAAITAERINAAIHPEDREMLLGLVARSMDPAGDGMLRAVYRVVWPCGEERWVNALARTFFAGEGGERRPVRHVGAVLDITEARRAERSLAELTRTLEVRVEERTRRLAEVNAELEAFAYSVSHDLRAPLRAMEGFATALVEDHADALPPEGRRYADRIRSAAHAMEELINDLLAYSRLTQNELELRPVSLAALAARSVADLSATLPPPGRIEVLEPLPPVRANAAALRQVIDNLLGNAAKFVAPGTAPLIRLRAETLPGERVRLWVEDNGIGIAPDHRDRIFNVFERLHARTAYPGTGIGLAIVRKAVERMGGTLGLESAVGEGSRFWVELPAAGRTEGEGTEQEP